MGTDGIKAWRKVGAFVAICAVVALGDMRESGSQAIASTASPLRTVSANAVAEVGSPATMGADEDGPASPADSAAANDDVHLVPAVYARDPDVRFVFFRQVSKWM